MNNAHSTSSASGTQVRWRYLLAGTVAVVVVVVIVVVFLSGGSNSSTTDAQGRPIPQLTPSASSYRDGQVITVTVGPNKYFAPYARIIILQCGDPGGTTANLPTSSSTCDGNTVPGPSVLVNKDGSFSTTYQKIFALPDPQIGDSPDSVPVCNKTHECVLYVGQNQNNFSAPKVFSAPFTVIPAASAKPSGS
jgi:hypothetical protein